MGSIVSPTRTRSIRSLAVAGALLLLAAVAAVALASGREGSDPDPALTAAPKVNAFDGRRAFAELRRQVGLGERPAGSQASRALAQRLRGTLPRGRFEAVGAQHPGLRNVVGSIPGAKPAIVVAAHYDTKAMAGFVGANDGASGTAAVLELARVLARDRRPHGGRELRFVFFDGEESPEEGTDFYATGLRGSKAYAARHADEVGALILLDFVGDRELRIPREAGSNRTLWAQLRRAARRVGTGATFPAADQGEVLDDHTPFARRGIPSIDLIDFDFACWHKTCDDLSAVSERSLDRAGETVLALVRELRRG